MKANSKSAIHLTDLDFYYNEGTPAEVHALKKISLSIEQGEYASFLGPSGCGKTTLLYAIAGIDIPHHGKIEVAEKNLMALSSKHLAIFRQSDIGIIFQNFNLIPSIRNVDNVSLPMAFLGMGARTRKKRAEGLLVRLGLEKMINRFPFELSGGQQQRVGIARALANDPSIILADEPIGNLDSESASNVLDILKDINHKEGKTVVMVTHEAWSLRDVEKTFYIRDGAIVRVEENEPGQKSPEAYYADLFPEITGDQVRSRALAHMFLRGYSDKETERLETLIHKRSLNQIGKEDLLHNLDKPFKEGGVGLWKGKAERIANLVELYLKDVKLMSDVLKKFHHHPEENLIAEVRRFREWLMLELNLRLDPAHLIRMDEVVSKRLTNHLGRDLLAETLNKPFKKGGLGLKISSALRLAERLEEMLQAGSRFEKNERK